jgi:serine/threonine-protein kinase
MTALPSFCPRCRAPVGEAGTDLCPSCSADPDATAAPESSAERSADPSATRYSSAAVIPSPSSPPTGVGSQTERIALPGYEILGELGRGGMGVVYKARQVRLKRLVALKMILSGVHADAEQLARFRAEGEAVASVQHPHIVQIYEVGEHEGLPYFSLEYVDGGSLSQKLNGTPLPAREAAQLVETLARAVHFAHERGIVHRDLKPANILLSLVPGHLSLVESETSALHHGPGTRDKGLIPKITDFGLAKHLGDSNGPTRSGAIMGTPSYMAPEQAAGRVRDIGPATDVYALGVILYELLTGRPPFKAETPLDTIRHVLERDPAPVRLLNPNVDHDLETICLKCLQKEAKDRYASAEALAADLARFQNGESISVRSVNMLDRLARALHRSQLEGEFCNWGNLVLCFAGIVFLTYSILTVVYIVRPPIFWVVATQGFQFLLMGLVFWRFRSRNPLPTSASERQLLSIWLGYVAACAMCGEISKQLVGAEKMYDGFGFPYFAIVAGLCFFIMGGSYWGRCYVLGLAYFVLACVMLWTLQWAVVEFGLMWTLCLTYIGLHLRRLGREAASSDPSPLSEAGATIKTSAS